MLVSGAFGAGGFGIRRGANSRFGLSTRKWNRPRSRPSPAFSTAQHWQLNAESHSAFQPTFLPQTCALFRATRRTFPRGSRPSAGLRRGRSRGRRGSFLLAVLPCLAALLRRPGLALRDLLRLCRFKLGQHLSPLGKYARLVALYPEQARAFVGLESVHFDGLATLLLVK